jgi:hypothetical protein
LPDAIKEKTVKKTALMAFAVLAIGATCAQAEPAQDMCTFDTCKAGTRALTYYKNDEPYFSCPTRELANYVYMVVGMVQLQATFGVLPNVSDKTGAPEYEGRSKELLDFLRSKAGVRTFDQAVALCNKGADGKRIMVLNMPENSSVAFVGDEDAKRTFWMPISHLNKAR